MDPLTAVLTMTRIEGGVLANVTAHGPWGFGAPAVPGAAFHAVTAGTCWLRVAGQPPRQLMPGDVVMFPTGAPHELASEPEAVARAYKDLIAEHPLGERRQLLLPGPGSCTRFLCAGYTYDRKQAHPLMSLLPPVLFLPAEPGSDAPAQATLRLLTYELRGDAPGSGAVVDRLIDVLFVHVVRAWLDTAAEDPLPSWLRAMRDPALARVLAMIHTAPEVPWTLETLARAAAMSRATLSRRFAEQVGTSPLGYLTAWRLLLAAQQLRDSDESIEVIARNIGYASPFAFSRAFGRHHGQPPSHYRNRHRTTVPHTTD